ncbi:MAG: site-specific integrase [Endomicrobium sp.]|jgi:integrase/recombinase XerD|nr:site-specific integrase [Endomicrobium sp.]
MAKKRSSLFHVKKRGKKGMYYVYYYNNAGIQVGEPISTDQQAVKPYIKKLLERLEAEKFGAPRKNYPFESFLEEYKNHSIKVLEKAPDSLKRDSYILKMFLSKFPHIKYVENFNADIVNEYKYIRRQDVCPFKKTPLLPTTIDKELSFLKALLTFANFKNYHLKNQSVYVQKITGEYKYRGTVPSADVVNNFISRFEHPHKTALIILGLTSMRPKEGVNLRYSWIDFENDMIYPNGTKTENADNGIPLVPELKEYLLKLKETAKSDIICADDTGEALSRQNFTVYCYKIRKKYNLPKITPYTLRHYSATTLFRKGASLLKVSKILRHSNVKMTSNVYINLTQEDLKEDMNLLQGSILTK